MPISAKFTFEGLVFKSKEYRLALEDALYAAMLKVAVVWVRTALHSVDDTFPVVTGMARGSFINLVMFLRGEGKQIGFDSLQGIQFDKVIPGKKSVTMGRRQSKQSNFIVVLRNQYGAYRYRFDWWTNVEHFMRNETDPDAKARFHLIHPTPWHVMQKSFDAAEKYLPVALRQMPKIIDYVDTFTWEVK
jgi:hypothetical protein